MTTAHATGSWPLRVDHFPNGLHPSQRRVDKPDQVLEVACWYVGYQKRAARIPATFNAARSVALLR